MPRAIRWLISQRLGLLLGLTILLNGCFQYDLTLRFDHQTHGQIIQSIALGERGLALARPTLEAWLADLKPSIQRLGGTLRENPDAIQLTVPFSTGPDLVRRFNQVFAESPALQPEATPPQWAVPGLGVIPYDLRVDQQNWGIASRTHLIYDLDLQDFQAPEAWADSRLERQAAAEISFRLQTPWGLRQVQPGSSPPLVSGPTEARWQLQLGQMNHIDVLFWLPSAVGVGSLIIVALVLIGYFLRYRVLTPPGRSP